MPDKAPVPAQAEDAASDHAAAYDAWFRSEVEAGLREANDPNTVWVTNEEVKRQSAQQRSKWLERIDQGRKSA